jgi:anti-sigma factor RsiW
MTCAAYETEISKILDNELAKDQQAPVFNHLAACESCREFFQASRFVRRHLEDAPAFPEHLDSAILDPATGHSSGIVLPIKQSGRRPIFFRRIPVPLPAAAAILLFLVVSLFYTFDAYESARIAEENIVFVPTLPEVEVQATIVEPLTPDTRTQ